MGRLGAAAVGHELWGKGDVCPACNKPALHAVQLSQHTARPSRPPGAGQAAEAPTEAAYLQRRAGSGLQRLAHHPGPQPAPGHHAGRAAVHAQVVQGKGVAICGRQDRGPGRSCVPQQGIYEHAAAATAAWVRAVHAAVHVQEARCQAGCKREACLRVCPRTAAAGEPALAAAPLRRRCRRPARHQASASLGPADVAADPVLVSSGRCKWVQKKSQAGIYMVQAGTRRGKSLDRQRMGRADSRYYRNMRPQACDCVGTDSGQAACRCMHAANRRTSSQRHLRSVQPQPASEPRLAPPAGMGVKPRR